MACTLYQLLKAVRIEEQLRVGWLRRRYVLHRRRDRSLLLHGFDDGRDDGRVSVDPPRLVWGMRSLRSRMIVGGGPSAAKDVVLGREDRSSADDLALSNYRSLAHLRLGYVEDFVGVVETLG